MEGKMISSKRKRSNLQLVSLENKRLNLSSEILTMTELCYLNTHNPLSENFSNITMWSNLTYVNLQNNALTVLPREFGKLRLLDLNLSENYFGTSNSTKWPWIEQNNIKNTLRVLDIRDNSLTELPFHIEKLNALVGLNVMYNLLKRLPQNIGNMKNLEFLNVAHNKLRYLPITLIFSNLHYLNVSMNPFQIQRNSEEYNNKYNIPSLAELSANIMLQYRIPYDRRLPRIFVQYFEEVECCFFCRRFGIGLLPLYLFVHIASLICGIVCYSGINVILFQIYCCLPCCEDKLSYIYNRNMNILTDYIRRQLRIRMMNYRTKRIFDWLREYKI